MRDCVLPVRDASRSSFAFALALMLSMAGTVAPSSSGSPNTEAYPSASMFSSAHSRASSYDCGLISSPPAHPEPSRLAHLVRGPPSECRKNSPVRLR